MRRLAAILLLAALPLGGCLQLLGIECEDSCSAGADQCVGNDLEVCSLSFVTGCLEYGVGERCGDRNAVCLNAQCVCLGTIDCGVCVDPATDPRNCGGCGHACAGTCVNGQCSP